MASLSLVNGPSRKRRLIGAIGLSLASISVVHAEEIQAASKQVPARVETADRFDWADAAIGAGVATGLLVTASAARGRKNWTDRGDRKEHK